MLIWVRGYEGVQKAAPGWSVCVQPENEDDLKKLQLMELAVMNGTYRGVEGNIVPFVAAATAGSRTFNIQLLLLTAFFL